MLSLSCAENRIDIVWLWGFMKIFKLILLSFLSIFVIIYLAFLFVLPYAVDLNQYSPQITKIIQDNTGLQVSLKGLKVKTAWNLSAGALIDKTDLKYTTGEKFAQINGLQIRLSLIPLFFNKIRIDEVDAEKVLADIDLVKIEKQKAKVLEPTSSLLPFAFSKPNFSTDMPVVKVKKYRISFIDSKNNYTAKGTDLKISEFVLGDKIKLKTNGNLILNERKQISYNIAVFSKVFPKTTSRENNLMKVFADLYKYNLQADINADLKIKPDSNIEGKVLFDKLHFTLAGNTLPQSGLALDFDGNKIKINSTFYTDVNSKIFITGILKNGKRKAIDLKVSSDKINLSNAILITNTVLKTMGRKGLDEIKASGQAKANFDIKSDFKRIESSGYLKIKNASVTNKLYNVSLNAVNADIDFSQDAVKIRQANANLNSQPITISGIVDKNANANILVLAKNLQLKGVLLTSGNAKILKENDVLGGKVNLRVVLKGRLDKASPLINVIVNDINLRNRKSKTQVKIAKAIIDTTSAKGKGIAKLVRIKIIPPTPAAISVPAINLIFDNNNIDIEKTHLYINNIKTNFSGKISNISSSPRLNNVSIDVPSLISVPVQGYAGSKMTVKGKLNFNGDLYKPEISGLFSVPLIRIPSTQTVIKNTTIHIDKDIIISAPQAQIADSAIAISANIDKNFSNGTIIKNLNFVSDNINLNTLIPFYSSLPQNSASSITILKGKSSIEKFKVGGIVSSNITSNLSMNNNILHMLNVKGKAYLGNIAGEVSYDLGRKKTVLELQGRGLSANPALIALTGRNDDIHGLLDFDSNVSLIGLSQSELLHSLKGHTDFIISNGRMGVLGKFEHLIYAQNIISNNVFKMTLNLIAKAVTVKNTGVYRSMTGKINFSNGWANINWVKTTGPSMSLYITGRYYLPNNTVNLIILGRISDDVVRILGPIGEFSMDKVISYIPKIGEITSFFASQFTTNPIYENISMIPPLTPKTGFNTKEFKVVIDGDVQKQSSVKSFKWLARPRIGQVQPQLQDKPKQKQSFEVPDFVKNLPDIKQ